MNIQPTKGTNTCIKRRWGVDKKVYLYWSRVCRPSVHQHLHNHLEDELNLTATEIRFSNTMLVFERVKLTGTNRFVSEELAPGERKEMHSNLNPYGDFFCRCNFCFTMWLNFKCPLPSKPQRIQSARQFCSNGPRSPCCCPVFLWSYVNMPVKTCRGNFDRRNGVQWVTGTSQVSSLTFIQLTAFLACTGAMYGGISINNK